MSYFVPFNAHQRAQRKLAKERAAVKVSFNIITVDGKAELKKAMDALYRKWDEGQKQRYATRRERAIALLLGEAAPVSLSRLELTEAALSSGAQSISHALTTTPQYEPYQPKKCNCPMFTLMVSGCKCGGC